MSHLEIKREGSTVFCDGKPVTDSSSLTKEAMMKVTRLKRKINKHHKRSSADSREIRTKVPAIRK